MNALDAGQQSSRYTTCSALAECHGVLRSFEHIVKLNSEIDLQKQLLKKLESLAQQILLQSLAARSAGKQDIPTALLNIFNAWADITLATPTLDDLPRGTLAEVSSSCPQSGCSRSTTPMARGTPCAASTMSKCRGPGPTVGLNAVSKT
ncbi:hypothetical protein C8R45DRAFT_1101883 [Mycena sanguinolenta]|nr:hypothetical protein C8R45DRAFT_1101883 [Mycena sanguinolenta]